MSEPCLRENIVSLGEYLCWCIEEYAALGTQDVNLIEVLGAALTSANPVIAGIFDAGGNRMPAGDAPARQLYTEDSGANTNPRRYEKDNGFYSAVVARAGGVATALWTIATAPARTAGQVTTIYTLEIENSTGAAVTGWLEIGGGAITVPIHVADDDSVIIDFVGGFNSGDADVNCNASVNDVVFSIKGTEV